MKSLYKGIDIGKLIAAILVVVLHATETTAWFPAGVKFILTKFAVPFFFITSGYFFYRGLSDSAEKKEYFWCYEKHLLKVLFVWELIIYLPFTVKTYMVKYEDMTTIRMMMLLFRRLFVIGSGPYWYLIALAEAVAIIFICEQLRDGMRILVFLIIIGAYLEISYSCFQGVLASVPVLGLLNKIIYGIWSCENNMLTFGIPFVGIGYVFAKYDYRLELGTAIIVFLIATIFRILEYFLPIMLPSTFWEGNAISLAFFPQAISFFMLTKAWNPNISGFQSRIIRQLSSTIYYTHLIFLYEIINPLMNKYIPLLTYNGSMIFPKVVVTVLLSTLFYIAIKKIGNPKLNILING